MRTTSRGTRVLRRRALPLALVILVGVMGTPFIAAAQDPRAEGEQLFQEKCAGCHTIGGGVLVGPDLEGVTELREHDWLVSWLADPPKMVASGDPIAVELVKQYNNVIMPNLGLTPTQIDGLLAYLAAPSGAPSGTPTVPPAPPPAGDQALGKAYFIGDQRFANDGPPCMACHSIAGIGSLGGGQLGPDLTGAYNKWGEAGLMAFVTQPPTVTMNTVWTQTPLTPQEGSDLVAFMKQASVSERPADTVAQLSLLAAGGAVLLLLLARLVWRERLTGVRRRMVAGSRR